MDIDVQFLRFCVSVGRNNNLIQGAGGNISFKDGDAIVIKASGTWLVNALEDDIFVAVSRRKILQSIGNGSDDFSAFAKGSLRPSIETPLHALLPQRYVLHVHLLDAVILAAICGDDAAETGLATRLRGIPFTLIPYARPGIPLCEEFQRALEQQSSSVNLYIMNNHGAVVAGESIEEMSALLREVVARLGLPQRPVGLSDTGALLEVNDCNWTMPEDTDIHALALDPCAPPLLSALPLYPDHAVFLGPRTLILASGQKLSAALESFRKTCLCDAKFAVYPGAGVLVTPDISSGEKAMLKAYADVVRRIPEGEELETLSEEDVVALCNWDAEKWRQSLTNNHGQNPCNGR